MCINNEIVNKFLTMKSDLVLSTELNCYPISFIKKMNLVLSLMTTLLIIYMEGTRKQIISIQIQISICC